MCATSDPVEAQLADYLEQVLRSAGIDCERQSVIPGRDNVIGVVHPTTPGMRNGLMLNSHMDTVPVANMSIDPFKPAVKDGLLYGRGSCDAKASIAAMVTAAIKYSQRPVRNIPVVFAAMADEEFSFSGSWKLIERDWPVSACIVGEPTQLASVIAHKGVVRWRVRVRGRSAHGATPELGHSAIFDGARVVLALEAYSEELTKREAHLLLGKPTINLGRMNAGQSVNVVPDECIFELERRLLPGEDGRAVLAECESFVRKAVADAQIEWLSPYLVDPPLETAADDPLVESLGLAQQSALGKRSAPRGAHYCTDGSKLAQKGITTVVCGPGDVAKAHTEDEHVELEQVEVATHLYCYLLDQWRPGS